MVTDNIINLVSTLLFIFSTFIWLSIIIRLNKRIRELEDANCIWGLKYKSKSLNSSNALVFYAKNRKQS